MSSIAELLSDARRMGYRGERVESAIIAHIDRETDNKLWSCIYDSHEKKDILRMRTSLMRNGVLRTSLQKPSELAQNRVKEVLHGMERHNPDIVFSGVSFDNWVAAATYVDSWVCMENISQSEIASKFDCSRSTISRLYPKIVETDIFDYVYSTIIPLHHSIELILSDMRINVNMLSYRINETTKQCNQRIQAAHANTNVKSRLFGDKEFYWNAS